MQSDDGKKTWLGQPTIITEFGETIWRKSCKEERRQLHQEHQGLLVERWMIVERWMRRHNPCTGQEWEHFCISPNRADLISQILLRELSENMDGVSMAQVTEMYRVINFFLETKTLGLRMVPIFNDGIWKLEALSDSDFANVKDTRYGVSMYTSFIFLVFRRRGRVKA